MPDLNRTCRACVCPWGPGQGARTGPHPRPAGSAGAGRRPPRAPRLREPPSVTSARWRVDPSVPPWLPAEGPRGLATASQRLLGPPVSVPLSQCGRPCLSPPSPAWLLPRFLLLTLWKTLKPGAPVPSAQGACLVPSGPPADPCSPGTEVGDGGTRRSCGCGLKGGAGRAGDPACGYHTPTTCPSRRLVPATPGGAGGVSTSARCSSGSEELVAVSMAGPSAEVPGCPPAPGGSGPSCPSLLGFTLGYAKGGGCPGPGLVGQESTPHPSQSPP